MLTIIQNTMSKFNKTSEVLERTTNLAGGSAYRQSAKMELISILLTSFVESQFYRSAEGTLARLVHVMKQVPPEFAAKAAIYARKTFGMRSITHAMASHLAEGASGKPWAASFYENIVFRADDITEILAYHLNRGQKVTASMKRGLGAALSKLDAYQLGKYKGTGAVKMVDAINMLHPAHTEPLAALISGTLPAPQTWEVLLSQAGNDPVVKRQVWSHLLIEKKLGYLALLRNLRNIRDQAPESLGEAMSQLTDITSISRAKVFPFQYLAAYKQFGGEQATDRVIRAALVKATRISFNNVAKLSFGGRTLVAVDNSGSMSQRVSSKSVMRMNEIGALFGITLAEAHNADLMEFGDRARYIPYDEGENPLRFAEEFEDKNQVGHGTSMTDIFRKAGETKYDRIVIFSDMQVWHGVTKLALDNYRHLTGTNPEVYVIDLAGNGSLQFPERKVNCLAGFSEQIFEVMATLEQDCEGLVKKVETVTL